MYKFINDNAEAILEDADKPKGKFEKYIKNYLGTLNIDLLSKNAEKYKSNYRHLLKEHVRVYEYTPGFVHAKNAISDDEVMTCGTVNMDYRSMYHNFENGVWVYRAKSVEAMKKDFLQAMEVSRKIDLDWVKARPLWYRFIQYIFKIMAPFL